MGFEGLASGAAAGCGLAATSWACVPGGEMGRYFGLAPELSKRIEPRPTVGLLIGGGFGRVASHPRNDYFNSAIEVAAAIAATTWEAIP